MNCIYKNMVKTITIEENIKNGNIQKHILEVFQLILYDIAYIIFKFKDDREEICGIDNSFYSKFEIDLIDNIIICDKKEDNIDVVKLREIYNTFLIAETDSYNNISIENIRDIIRDLLIFTIIEEPINNIEEDVRVVVSENDFNTLKEIDVEGENCAICLEKIETKAIILPCKHVYHNKCIKEWLCNHSYKCPICKNDTFKGVPIIND